MAKTKIKRKFAEQAIRYLLCKASESGGKRFRVGKYEVIPKAAFTEDGLLLIFTQALPEYASKHKLESIIVDVLGLHENKVTQVEIYENGEVVYSPGRNRDEHDVQRFVEALAKNLT